MARTQAVFYRDARGAEPVDLFIDDLPPRCAAKIDAYIDEYLNGMPPDAPPPPFPITSQVDGELRELRVRFADTRYRVLYQRSGNLIVLLHAIEKHTGALPKGAIDLAKRRMGGLHAPHGRTAAGAAAGGGSGCAAADEVIPDAGPYLFR